MNMIPLWRDYIYNRGNGLPVFESHCNVCNLNIWTNGYKRLYLEGTSKTWCKF